MSNATTKTPPNNKENTDKRSNKKSTIDLEWRSPPVMPKKALSHGISPRNFHGRRRSRPGQAKVERMQAEAHESLMKEGKKKVGLYQELQRSAFRQLTELRTWPIQARAFSHLDHLMKEYLHHQDGDNAEETEESIHLTSEKGEEYDSIASSSSAVSVELEPKRVLRDMLTSPAKSRLKLQYQQAFLAERSLRRPVPTTHKWTQPLWSTEPRVFSTEKSSGGKRKYIVGHLGRFLDLYWRKGDPLQRHYYELIQENTPCRLYLDLEFSKTANPELTDTLSEKLMDELFLELSQEFSKEFDLELSLERCHIVDLDSSTESKFSRHWIVHLPGEFLFTHNVAAGKFMTRFVGRLADDQAIGRLSSERPTLQKFLLVNTGASKSSEKDPFKKTCFIDLGVYTRNRLFRLMGSSKFGKPASAALRISQFNTFPFPDGFNNDCFYIPSIKKSLDGVIHEPRSTSSNADDGEEMENALQKFIAQSDWTIHAEALAQTLVVPAHASKIDFPILPFDEDAVNDTDTARDAADAPPRLRNSLVNSVSVGPSPFPALDLFVQSELGSRKGVAGSIRAWSVEVDPDTHLTTQIVYQMSRNRFCECVDRHHKSNNIFWIVDFSTWRAVQGCHDPECRLLNFRGSPVSLPSDIVELTQDVLFEQQLAAFDEQALLCPAVTSPPSPDVKKCSVPDALGDVDASFERALLALNIDDAEAKSTTVG